MRLSAPNAISDRLCAATPDPIATAASISIHAAVIHSRQKARQISLDRAAWEATGIAPYGSLCTPSLFPESPSHENAAARAKVSSKKSVIVQSPLNPATAFAVGLPIAYAFRRGWIRI